MEAKSSNQNDHTIWLLLVTTNFIEIVAMAA